MPEQQPVTPALLTVHWDTVIGVRNESYDPETGAPEGGEPIELGAMVVEAITERLVREIKRDVNDYRYRNAVEVAKEAAREAIAAEATRLVREALDGEIRPTNRYGEPQGEPTTLRDMIRADIAAYLGEKPSRYSGDERKGGFRALLREEVDKAMSRDLNAVIIDARRQVVDTVKAKANELFASIAVKG
jgi:Arc/MetJ-type ribon-helix-helix transcriptional regulator